MLNTLLSIAGPLLSMYGSHRAAQAGQTDWSSVKKDLDKRFSGTSGLISDMKDRSQDFWNFGGDLRGRGDSLWSRAEDMWDPFSTVNQQQFDRIGDQTQDASAAVLRNLGRQQSSLGLLGGTGGQAVAQQLGMARNLQTGAADQWNQYLNQSRGMGNQLFGQAQGMYNQAGSMFGAGTSALQNALSAQGSMDSAYANAQMAIDQANKQAKVAGWGGFAEGMGGLLGTSAQGGAGIDWESLFKGG